MTAVMLDCEVIILGSQCCTYLYLQKIRGELNGLLKY